MPARVKLKEIDGAPHKWWSMWFNSMIREKSYLGSKCKTNDVEICQDLVRSYIGAAWLSSARVVRCWVKSRNERNPHSLLPTGNAGNS